LSNVGLHDIADNKFVHWRPDGLLNLWWRR